MDFHVLTRRELQTLCKRNKIPANITNVAMAEALEALEKVDGLEEIGNASPGKLDLTSPYVPSVGRSTRRRNPVEKETTTQRTTHSTRRTSRKDLDGEGLQTPSVSQGIIKKDEIGSACRKIDSQLENCMDEGEVIQATPANVGVADRRGRVKKVDTAVKSVYSTRRSARLAQKSVKLDLDMKENSELPKMDFAAVEYIQSVGVNESLNEADATSEITELDEVQTARKCGAEGEPEVVSLQQQELSTASETKAMTTIENVEADVTKSVEEKCDAEGEVEVVSQQEQELPIENKAMPVENVEAGDIESAVDEKCDAEDGPEVFSVQDNELPIENIVAYGTKAQEEKCEAEGEEEVVSVQAQELPIENKAMDIGSVEYDDTAVNITDADDLELQEDEDEKLEKLPQFEITESYELPISDIGIPEESFTNINSDNGYEAEEQSSVNLHVETEDLSRNAGNCCNGDNVAEELEKESLQYKDEVHTGFDGMEQQINVVTPESLDLEAVANEEDGSIKRKTSSFALEILDYIQKEDPPTEKTNQNPLEKAEEQDRTSEKHEELELFEAGVETPTMSNKQLNTSIGTNFEVMNHADSDFGGPNMITPMRESTAKKKFSVVASDNKENICSGGGTGIKLALTKEKIGKKIAKGAGANNLSLRQLKKKVSELEKEKL